MLLRLIIHFLEIKCSLKQISSLAHSTITRRIEELEFYILKRVQERKKFFLIFATPLDKSSNMLDVVQLLIFIPNVNDNWKIKEELRLLENLTDTITG